MRTNQNNRTAATLPAQEAWRFFYETVFTIRRLLLMKNFGTILEHKCHNLLKHSDMKSCEKYDNNSKNEIKDNVLL